MFVAAQCPIQVESGAFVFGLFGGVPEPQHLEPGFTALEPIRMGEHPLGKQRGEMFVGGSDGQRVAGVLPFQQFEPGPGSCLPVVRQSMFSQTGIELAVNSSVCGLLSDEPLDLIPKPILRRRRQCLKALSYGIDEKLLTDRKTHGQRAKKGAAKRIISAPVAGDGCVKVDQQAANGQCSHGAASGRWGAGMVRVDGGTVKYQLTDWGGRLWVVRVIPEREILICLKVVRRALRATISPMDIGTAANVEHRRRLLDGLAQVVALKGYADTTIADIVREAGVSRRTFYEHFSSKSEALIALYEIASHNGLRVLEEHIDTRREWSTQVEQALQAYLACLAQRPVLLRTLFIDILGLGQPGLLARRRVHESIASFVLEVVNARQAPPPLDRATALAVVGGIHELVLHAIEQEPVADLLALAEPAARLVRAVARPPTGT